MDYIRVYQRGDGTIGCDPSGESEFELSYLKILADRCRPPYQGLHQPPPRHLQQRQHFAILSDRSDMAQEQADRYLLRRKIGDDVFGRQVGRWRLRSGGYDIRVALQLKELSRYFYSCSFSSCLLSYPPASAKLRWWTFHIMTYVTKSELQSECACAHQRRFSVFDD